MFFISFYVLSFVCFCIFFYCFIGSGWVGWLIDFWYWINWVKLKNMRSLLSHVLCFHYRTGICISTHVYHVSINWFSDDDSSQQMIKSGMAYLFASATRDYLVALWSPQLLRMLSLPRLVWKLRMFEWGKGIQCHIFGTLHKGLLFQNKQIPRKGYIPNHLYID